MRDNRDSIVKRTEYYNKARFDDTIQISFTPTTHTLMSIDLIVICLIWNNAFAFMFGLGLVNS